MNLSFWASISADALFAAVADDENLRFARSVLVRLRIDPVLTDRIARQIEAGRIEIRTLLSWLAREMQPATYKVEQDPQRMRPSDVPILIGDSEKFRSATGWKPQIL